MRLLFTAPGFHTNQYFASKTLYENGVGVHYLILRKNKRVSFKYIKEHVSKIKRIPKFLSFILKFLRIDTKPRTATNTLQAYPSLRDVKSKLKEIKPDVVIIRGRTTFSLIVSIACKQLKIKSLRYEQVILENDKNFINKKINKYLFKIIKKIQNLLLPKVLVTPIVKNLDMSFEEMKKRRRYFLPLPIEVSETKKSISKNKIRMILVGKYEPRKNHLLFLKSVSKLKDKYDLEITFIGTKKDEFHLDKIKNFVKDNNLSKIVNFKYNLKHEEVLRHYSKHDLFVLPAHSEEFGYSPLEALSYGLPILVSSDAGCQYLINNKKRNGYVFDINNPDDLTKKLELLIFDKKRLEKYGENAKDFVKKYYSTEKYMGNLRKILKEEFDLKLK